jgi:hypothetical protein
MIKWKKYFLIEYTPGDKTEIIASMGDCYLSTGSYAYRPNIEWICMDCREINNENYLSLKGYEFAQHYPPYLIREGWGRGTKGIKIKEIGKDMYDELLGGALFN